MATRITNSFTPSLKNNSTTALGAGETFTGEGELDHNPDVGVSCFSDTAGTLYFDFSIDGTNWRTFPSNGFDVAANVHEFHTAVKLGRHFRTRFTNGSSAQSTFQLQTYFGEFRQPNAPLNQPLGLDADAILVRPTFPWLDISRSLVSGMSVVKKFGRNDAVGTSFVPVCEGGIYQTPQSGSATALRIKAGGSADDAAAGTGAREVTLEGLDENFAAVTEAIATNGASASTATTATFTRLFRAYVSASGTYATSSAGSHAADITIENSAGGTDWAIISDAIGFPLSTTEIGAYSVAAGSTAYVFLDDLIVDSAKTNDIVFFVREDIDQTAAPYSPMQTKAVLSGISDQVVNLQGSQVPFGPFTGPCDLGFMAKVNTGTSNVSVEFEIFVVAE